MKKNQLPFIEVLVTSILVGLIWTIQRVHYPSFQFINSLDYQQFQIFHVNAITPMVAPLMVFELCVCLLNIYFKNYSKAISVSIFCLLAIIWLTTAFLSVPIHNQLSLGKDNGLIIKLVNSNWIRTIAWTVKLLILSLRFKNV